MSTAEEIKVHFVNDIKIHWNRIKKIGKAFRYPKTCRAKASKMEPKRCPDATKEHEAAEGWDQDALELDLDDLDEQNQDLGDNVQNENKKETTETNYMPLSPSLYKFNLLIPSNLSTKASTNLVHG